MQGWSLLYFTNWYIHYSWVLILMHVWHSMSVVQRFVSSACADIFRNRALLSLILNCFLFKGEIKEILLDAQELMAKWQAANPPRKQTWSDWQSSLHDSWSEFRPTIFKSLLQTTFAFLEDVMCQKCMVHVAVLRCQDCGKHLYHGCDSSVRDWQRGPCKWSHCAHPIYVTERQSGLGDS